MSALMVAGLRAGYGSTEILHGVSLDVREGEVVGLLGRNGVGKSTLVKAVAGVLPSRGGQVLLDGQDVTRWPSHRVARHGVAYVPQDGGLFDELSVAANLQIPLGRGERLARAAERAFKAFPVLADRLAQRAGTLSGGERKMLMVARVLLQRARLVLLDEVTEGVQPSVVAQMAAAIEEERARGVAVLMVEQKLRFALEQASRYIVMKGGAIVDQGMVDATTAEAIEEHLVL
jgi:branched-chain amino acid transport system ATP-binding protein